MPMETILAQGYDFDAYEVIEKGSKKTEFLCNVTAEAFDMVKQGEYVRIDFDGDGEMTWGVVITKKDRKNNRMYYYVI